MNSKAEIPPQIIKPRTKIRIKDHPGVFGRVHSICISGPELDVIEYGIILWSGIEGKVEWVYAYEIEVMPTEGTTGFAKTSQPDNPLINKL